MSAPTDVFAALQAMCAGEFRHLNGSLAEHLRGTEALLTAWGARDALRLAGLYHAVYGTDGYNPALSGLDTRPRVAALIGDEAEALAYLYCACDRGRFYPRIGGAEQYRFVDRFMAQEYAIVPAQLRDLCELVLANELELAGRSEDFRARYGAPLAALFRRMRGQVGAAGYAHFERVLGAF